MSNKIIVEIEALDYKINVRDVAEALKSHFPNMPTKVKEHAVEQKRALDLPYFCGECGNRISMPHHPRCSHFEAAIQ